MSFRKNDDVIDFGISVVLIHIKNRASGSNVSAKRKW